MSISSIIICMYVANETDFYAIKLTFLFFCILFLINVYGENFKLVCLERLALCPFSDRTTNEIQHVFGNNNTWQADYVRCRLYNKGACFSST